MAHSHFNEVVWLRVKQYPTEPEEHQRKFSPSRTADDYFNYAGALWQRRKKTTTLTGTGAFTFLPIAPLFLSSIVHSDDSQEMCWTTIIYIVEVALIPTNINNLTVWNNTLHKTQPQWINSFLVMSLYFNKPGLTNQHFLCGALTLHFNKVASPPNHQHFHLPHWNITPTHFPSHETHPRKVTAAV